MFFAEEGLPTSVDFIRCEPNQMVASYTTGSAYIFDLETGKDVLQLESKISGGKCWHHKENRSSTIKSEMDIIWIYRPK